jgi:hypothetical protein
MTSAGGEAASERWKGGDNVSWADVNFTEPKNKEIYAVDSTSTNGLGRFKTMMSYFIFKKIRSSFIHLIT